MNGTHYYLGLDIGTDSVGYAVTDKRYDLLKFRSDPIWGVTTFEAADLAEARRVNRTARRRIDRRQQRIQMLSDLFAPEICKLDPQFFVRRKESALFAEDTNVGVRIFNGGITDEAYHKRYPTIHHLILDLMTADSPQDVRLVYLACAWLVANRGHFLSDANTEQVGDFLEPYEAFIRCFTQNYECDLPWSASVPADSVQAIMQEDRSISQKKALFKETVFHGKAPANKPEESFPFHKDIVVTLLAGGKASPADLFCNDEYKEIESVSLAMDDENFERILSDLGEDAVLLRAMRAMYDCALLNATLQGKRCISEAKVATYDQHRKDLAFLKYFLRKYQKKDYAKVLRDASTENYTAYTGNVKNCTGTSKFKKASKEKFCDFLKKIVQNTTPDETDREKYDDMMQRLQTYTFLPKQKNSDNRVIPHQLYEYELSEILSHAAQYLPLLRETDASGITTAEKIKAIFRFRIPYFVGPLNAASPHAWLKRETGKIYPWNFEQMVDLDISEQRFIRRMTNTCTYLPGEDVLPLRSLLYSRFMVLNEINHLKINQKPIPVAIKQEIFRELFEKQHRKVTLKRIQDYLKSRGYIGTNDEISGVDSNVTSNLRSYHSFQKMLTENILTEEQVEEIICQAAYSEDKKRLGRWLQGHYPALSEEDRKYILRLDLKGFGRLSRRLLTQIMGCATAGTGEALSIMDALWQTNDDLMQLLSERYTFREQIEYFEKNYYADPETHRTLSERLSEMYVSNTVKRQIIRSLDICTDIVKAMGRAPERIFIEMARGGAPDQKGKRTKTRKQQILDLYQKVRREETVQLRAELESMGEMADNRLQSDKLFLYYMQLGKCIYTGQPIELSKLATKAYDIDHIYPQSKIQDDSILNNRVLCLAETNGAKGDRYPIDQPIRERMRGFWELLRQNGLITEEKFHRLTRSFGFTEDELHQFINRQLVETRQSTKVVAQLLKERYPTSEIVYVKAGMVSRFRQEFDLLKCRCVNDLHHAKDAYLNIVVGNVYHERFTRRWFDVTQDYTLNIRPLFTHPVIAGGATVWQGESDLARVKKTASKNVIHLTRYAFCRKGGLFDQLPLKASAGLIPRKKNLPAEKYGGYNKPTASFYLLVSYTAGKKKDAMFAPVELRFAERVRSDPDFAAEYIAGVISEINSGKSIANVRIQLNGRPIKINTVLSLDGMLITINGKSSKGKRLIVSGKLPLVVNSDTEQYLKRIDSFSEKKRRNPKLLLDQGHDGITLEKNHALYLLLLQKLRQSVFSKCPGNPADTVAKGLEKFDALPPEEQVPCLLSLTAWFNHASTIDLASIGGASHSGAKLISAKLSTLAKDYRDIRIVDMSPSGLFESRSENLLKLL